jgi:general secretion pathway protein D
MKFSIRLRLWTGILGCIFLVGWLAGCSAKQLFNEGALDIKAGRWEIGLAKIEDAVKKDPDSAFLRTELRLKRAFVIESLLQNADAARSSYRFTEARELYNHVLDLDRDNARAKKGIESARTSEMTQEEIRMAKDLIDHRDLKEARTQLAHIISLDPSNLEAKQLLDQLSPQPAQNPQAAQALQDGPPKPKLRPKDSRIAALDFRDTPLNMVFQALARTTGLNFVLDKDVKGDAKTSIFLKDLPVESALDLVLAQHMLEKKIMSENTIYIYPESADKRRRFEEQIVKSFYLTNTDPKQAMNLLKVMLDTKVLFVDERAKLLVMRDTPEVVRMAEKLIASLDQEDSEVMMEVEIVEIQRSKLQELGIKYPNQITLSALAPTVAAAAGAPATAATAVSSMLLGDLFTLNTNRVRTSALAATIDLRAEAGQVNILSNPRIRARNYEKAKILIGDRVPVITNAVTPTSTGSPVVTGNVQYLEVGLKFEVEPTIYRGDEVAMKVSLEVSNIVKEVPNPQSGTLAYQIGTRTVTTVLRLKDGETQVLGGLITEDDRETASKIPGLGSLPILGRLFSSQRDANNKTEIVLSITPHIIRHGVQPDASMNQFWYGTETTRGVPMMIRMNEDNRNPIVQSKGASVATGLPQVAPSPGAGVNAGLEMTTNPIAPLPAPTAAGATTVGIQPESLPPVAPAPIASPENAAIAPVIGTPIAGPPPPIAPSLKTGASAAPGTTANPTAPLPAVPASGATTVGVQPLIPPPITPAPAANPASAATAPAKGAPVATGPPPAAPALGAGSSAGLNVGSAPFQRKSWRKPPRGASEGGQPSYPSANEPTSSQSQENAGAVPSKGAPEAASLPPAEDDAAVIDSTVGEKAAEDQAESPTPNAPSPVASPAYGGTIP